MIDCADQDDEVERVDVIEREWVIRRSKLKKCRCPKGCTVETASAPPQLIDGGRHTTNVAVTSAIDEYASLAPSTPSSRRVLMNGGNPEAYAHYAIAAILAQHPLSQKELCRLWRPASCPSSD